MKNSFVLYSDYLPQIELLDMEQRGCLFTAIMQYSAGLDILKLDAVTSMAFSFIKSQIDCDKEKYNKAIEAKRENGKLGGRPKTIHVLNCSENEEEGFDDEKPKKPNGYSKNLIKPKKPNGYSENLKNLTKHDNDYVNDNVNNNNVVDIDICTEPSEAPVLTIPLNDKSEYPISQSDIDEWQELYPAVDVVQELRSMRGWSNANPEKRKTKKGVKRFINAWLAREQNRGSGTRDRPKSGINRADSPDYNALAVQNFLGRITDDEG